MQILDPVQMVQIRAYPSVILPRSAQICPDLPRSAQICPDLPRSAQICPDVPGVARAWSVTPGLKGACAARRQRCGARVRQRLGLRALHKLRGGGGVPGRGGLLIMIPRRRVLALSCAGDLRRARGHRERPVKFAGTNFDRSKVARNCP
eukprot:gene15946-biopygen3726